MTAPSGAVQLLGAPMIHRTLVSILVPFLGGLILSDAALRTSRRALFKPELKIAPKESFQ